MKNVASIPLKTKSVRAFFGQNETYCLQDDNCIDLYLKIPAFGHNNMECIISQPGRTYQKLGFHLLETTDKLVGAFVQEVTFPLEDQTYKIYLNFLEVTKGWNLLRVWNYVPYINDETMGLENYKSFCKGRSLAFEAFNGQGFTVTLPAASAVGINDNKLVIYFIAAKEPATYIENPEQVSAFFYPAQYGPRSPSFARGSVLSEDGKKIGYLSGTASIKGHQSVTLQDVTEQLHTTLDNMSLVFERMGLVHERMSFSRNLPDPEQYERHFKVYIKHQTTVPYIQELFEQSIWASEEDRIIYVQADICRSELALEIEALVQER